MRNILSSRQGSRTRRWAPIVVAAGMLALLSGCVVYPAGGYYGPPRGYYHDYYR